MKTTAWLISLVAVAALSFAGGWLHRGQAQSGPYHVQALTTSSTIILVRHHTGTGKTEFYPMAANLPGGWIPLEETTGQPRRTADQ